MSGGPYGRAKAPERTCLKLKDWPPEDRRPWQAACTPTDPLSDDEGARANHSVMSNRKAERGYGRWLTFLQNIDPLAWLKRWLSGSPKNGLAPISRILSI